ncbi:MAG: DUF262 domain-containing protein [Planctomycetes bacterium]|nr:DUF262 domain-containing protein [Planctomycetota bacterium]
MPEMLMNSEDSAEELTESLNEIAESLAELSALEDLPPVVSRPHVPRSKAEILDGISTTLFSTLIYEQEWLNLDGEAISRESFERDPLTAMVSFFVGIGMSDDEAGVCVIPGDSGPRLTTQGADALSIRLAAALRCAQRCMKLAASDETDSRKEEWEQAWSEELTDEVSSPLPIVAKSATWPIADLAAKADRGQLVLNPTYQRDDVWKLSDSSALIESILRGIPLPSIVLLEVPRPGKNRFSYEVVDGKQRITSILRFIGRHPKAVEKAKDLDRKYGISGFTDALRRDYRRFVKLWKEYVGQKLTSEKEREFMLPFKVKGGRLK